jgi:hypothetical protein
MAAGYLFYEGGLDIWKDGSAILTGSNVASHRTTDEGGSWSTTNGGVSAFTQIDSTLFQVSTSGLKKSTDHGATWTATTGLPAGVGPQSLTSKDEDLFVGTSDGVYRSSDKGGTWTAINEGLAPKNAIYKISHDDQYLYAGTTTRSLWRRPLSQVTAVREISNRIPSGFSISQNFPNPFNPNTTIQFSIPGRQMTTLMVYDVLGEVVETLVNEVKEPGVYGVTWDASKFPSGVYLCRLTTQNFSQTRTLLLVK